MKQYTFGSAFRRGVFLCAAICLTSALIATEAEITVAPVNPAFLRWQDEQAAAQAALLTAADDAAAEARPCGIVPSPFDSSYLATLPKRSRTEADFCVTLATIYKETKLTAIKDQGDHGTCWAHAVCAALETAVWKKRMARYDFSENNLANLHGFDLKYDKGGNDNMASAYLLRWNGPVLESQDPYGRPKKSKPIAPKFHVQQTRWIPARTSDLDLRQIKEAVMAYGGVSAGYFHEDSCYNKANAAYYNATAVGSTNHGVMIVGWNDIYPKSNFNSEPPGNGAFIVRNSWGTSWGDDGYFYVSYYDKTFARHTMCAFPSPENTDNYTSVYQHDPLGNCGSIGINSADSGWGANLFTATKSEMLSAVGFYALVPGTRYTVRIYTDCEANAPTSGMLTHEQSGETDSAGFFTIPLTTAVRICEGMRFSVVFHLATPGYTAPFAIEYAISGYSSKASAKAGESFFSSSGITWTDLITKAQTANFCFKAYMSAWMTDPAENDAFEAAFPLSGTGGGVISDNTGATRETGEPVHGGVASATTSLWWTWTAPESGCVQFSTAGSGLDTVLSVYTGSSLATLSAVAANDDSGSLQTSLCTFDAVKGTVYRIAVSGKDGEAGILKLAWNLTVSTLPNLTFARHPEWSRVIFLSTGATDTTPQSQFPEKEAIYFFGACKNDGYSTPASGFTIKHEILTAAGTVLHTETTARSSVPGPGVISFWAGAYWTVFEKLPAGSYTYRCTLDSKNVIAEVTETDNVAEYPFEIVAPATDPVFPDTVNETLRAWLTEYLADPDVTVVLAENTTVDDLDAARLLGVVPEMVADPDSKTVTVAAETTFTITELEITEELVRLTATIQVARGELPEDFVLPGLPGVRGKHSLTEDWSDLPLTPVITREGPSRATLKVEGENPAFKFYRVIVN